MTKNTLLAVFGLLILFGLFGYVYSQRADLPASGERISSFEECVAAGNPVMESVPRKCTITFDGDFAYGQSFVEQVLEPTEDEDEQPTPDPDNDNDNADADLSDLIRIASPLASAKINSPLTITGDARGTWYFEATFPVKLFDANGKLLVSHYATAQGEWMTENFVPFTSTLTFATPTTATGTLVLEKDNPSGLPEHDNALIVPVVF